MQHAWRTPRVRCDGRIRCAAGWCLLAGVVFVFPVRADVFHLTDGGEVSGDLLGTEQGHYRIRTVVGIVSLPTARVTRIEAAETPFAEYEQRVAIAADTATAQCALGAWCAEQGLRAEGQRHYRRALELDGNCAAARRALGYVRVGQLWVDGRCRAQRKPRAEDAEQRRLVRAIQTRWYQRLRAIKSARLDSGDEALVRKGAAQIRAIRDPVAIVPLVDVLREGSEACRLLLVEALSAFPQDEATMHLALVGLVEAYAAPRRRAVAELVRRQDGHVIAHYRAALHCGNDVVLKRAAYGLGELRAAGAVPDLIDLLTAERTKAVEVPAQDWLIRVPNYFFEERVASLPRGAARSGRSHADIGIHLWAHEVSNVWTRRRVTVYRTEVREALRKITGEDFGFDAAAWQRWREQQEGAGSTRRP